MKKALSILLFAGVLISILSATGIDDFIKGLKKRLNAFQNERPVTNVYVHLDKNNYLTNESIWFKAYVLSTPDTGNRVLFVRLTNKDKKIILTYQCPIYDIRANGDILLPDTLKEGEYYFYAFTNQMINYHPDQIFVQKIKVFKNAAESMEAEASVTDTAKLRRGQSIDILVKIKKNGVYVSDSKGIYQLWVDNKVIKTGKVTTNYLGEAVITFTYPQLTDDQAIRVKAKFVKDNNDAELSLNLRHEASPVIVRAYPEGGHLIDGIVNNVVIEAADNHNNPLVTDLVLKNDGKPVTSVTTNKYGIAHFNLTPQPNAHYYFVVPGNTNKKPAELTTRAEPAGFGLRIKKAGSQCYALISNKGKSDSVTLVLRSVDEVLWDKSINLKSGDSTRIDLPVNDYPKAILSLAIFDNKGDCAAERLFMNKAAENYKISITTDSASYGQRKKVKVTISAKNLDGNAAMTNLSVAVVEKTRISTNSYHTILDSYYYKALNISFPDQYYSSAGADDMDNILITKNWWANNWNDILRYQARGYLRVLKNSTGVSGLITRINHKPVDIQQLFIFSKAALISVPVNKDGSFNIRAADLTTEKSEQRYLILNDDFYNKYEITLKNYENEYDFNVKYSEPMMFLEPYNTFERVHEKAVMNQRGNIQLHEVKISSRASNYSLQPTEFVSKDCSDYVCMYNILNCPNHHFGTQPVEGGVYNYRGHSIIYHGCNAAASRTHFLLKNISLPTKFILPDYDKDPSNEAELRSTIYWNPNVNITKSGTVSFEFFTSDIKGDFTIMAQGIDIKTLRPVYSTGSFTVK